ncbi:MAG TPA: tetratricopeptide repeat protein, partial [Vicinamibacterales bacterium]|nr:tetratricopeptide repeat protein [Vicinamibacterales bacterium]
MQTRCGLVVALVILAASLACSNADADKQRYYESGNQFFEQKKYQEAVVEYRNAIAIDELFGEARYKLAESYAALGDARNAYQHYIRAADLLPANSELQLKAATLLVLAGRFDDAKTRVRSVLDKDPRNVQAHVLLGNVMARSKDLEGAVSQIEEAIEVDPSRGASYSSLGAVRLAQGDRDAARNAFEKAVEIDPNSLDARMALAMFQLQIAETAQAEQTLQAALAIDGKHALANRMMAMLHIASNRAADAEKYIKAYVDATRDDRAQFILADY